ncbi:unnamed protein product, partial [Chrysoparadoxa australica]
MFLSQMGFALFRQPDTITVTWEGNQPDDVEMEKNSRLELCQETANTEQDAGSVYFNTGCGGGPEEPPEEIPCRTEEGVEGRCAHHCREVTTMPGKMMAEMKRGTRCLDVCEFTYPDEFLRYYSPPNEVPQEFTNRDGPFHCNSAGKGVGIACPLYMECCECQLDKTDLPCGDGGTCIREGLCTENRSRRLAGGKKGKTKKKKGKR